MDPGSGVITAGFKRL